MNEEDLGGVSLGLEKLVIGDASKNDPSRNSSSTVTNFKPSKGHGPIDKFFQSFADFQYNPSERIELEFQRLGRVRKWNLKKQRFKKVRSEVFGATGEEIHFHLTRVDLFAHEIDHEQTSSVSLASRDSHILLRFPTSSTGDGIAISTKAAKPWRSLCEVLGVFTIQGHSYPQTITQCRKV